MTEWACDNCGNDSDVELLAFEDGPWVLCMPCREAKRGGDQATFDARRRELA